MLKINTLLLSCIKSYNWVSCRKKIALYHRSIPDRIGIFIFFAKWWNLLPPQFIDVISFRLLIYFNSNFTDIITFMCQNVPTNRCCQHGHGWNRKYMSLPLLWHFNCHLNDAEQGSYLQKALQDNII